VFTVKYLIFDKYPACLKRMPFEAVLETRSRRCRKIHGHISKRNTLTISLYS